MKNTILLLALGVVCNIYTACSKDNASLFESSITGTWELRSVYGGFGLGSYTFEPGNGNTWKFTDSSYERYIDGIFYSGGKYGIVKDLSPQTGELMGKIILNGDSANSMFAEIVNDTLITYNGVVAADGFINRYAKINE
jgi:hypothetical protein